MEGINQQLVRNYLETTPTHQATEADLKRLLAGKNWKKVINPMLAKGSLVFNAVTGYYSIGVASPIGMSSSKPAYPMPLMPGPKVLQFLKTRSINPVVVDANNLVELTLANVEIVNYWIPRGIPGLAKKYLPHAHDVYNRLSGGTPSAFNFRNRSDVYEVVAQIDKDNGTLDLSKHYGSAVNAFTDYIINPANNFETRLNGSVITIKQLVADLLNNFMSLPVHYKAKSLASKVCKYFHEYRYNNDLFFINDSVVRSILPYYCDKYGISHPSPSGIEHLSYEDLYDLLDALYAHCPAGMTKSDMDHILWYCYRK